MTRDVKIVGFGKKRNHPNPHLMQYLDCVVRHIILSRQMAMIGAVSLRKENETRFKSNEERRFSQSRRKTPGSKSLTDLLPMRFKGCIPADNDLLTLRTFDAGPRGSPGRVHQSGKGYDQSDVPRVKIRWRMRKIHDHAHCHIYLKEEV